MILFITEMIGLMAYFWESYFAIEFCTSLLEQKKKFSVKLAFSVLLTAVIYFCNEAAVLPVFTVLIAIVFVTVVSLERSKRMLSFFYSYLYYFFVYAIDLFVFSITAYFLKTQFILKGIVINPFITRSVILVLSKILLTIIILLFLHYAKPIKTALGKKYLISIVILGAALDTYATILTFEDITLERLFGWLMLFSLISLIYAICSTCQQYSNERSEREIVKLQNELMNQQYTELMKDYREGAKLHHDSINHLYLIQNLIREEKFQDVSRYIKGLIENVEIIHISWSGNKVIDFIINRKKMIAEEAGIQVELVIDPVAELPVRADIFNIVFSNLLDNAIEACKEKGSTEAAWIKVSIRKIYLMTIIKIENPIFQLPPICCEDGWVTTKTDRIRHGWGLKSVSAAVESCGGSLQFDSSHGTFQVIVTFFGS